MHSFATNQLCAQETLCSRELMRETVKVMNKALHEGSSRGDETNGVALGEWISNGKTLRIQVFSAKHMIDREPVLIRFDEKRVKLVETEREVAVDASMKVTEEHLAEVYQNPDAYISDPLKIELIWVKERMTASEA